jgi:hypothetical protein
MTQDYTKSTKQMEQEATDRALAEFLARGGKIQVVPTGKSGIPEGGFANAWGRKKRVAAVEPEAAEVTELVEPMAAEDEAAEITGDEVVFVFDDDDETPAEQ